MRVGIENSLNRKIIQPDDYCLLMLRSMINSPLCTLGRRKRRERVDGEKGAKKCEEEEEERSR